MSAPIWRKSSRSGGTDNSSCVEVANLLGAIGIRDSKDPHGPVLAFSGESFADLIAQVKRHELNL